MKGPQDAVGLPSGVTVSDSAEGVEPSHLGGFFAGWRRPVTPTEHLRLMRGSDVTVLAWDHGASRVVGFVTALTDGVLCAQITLLEVLPAHRGRGIGSALVRRVLRRLGDLYAVDVVCDPGLLPFYRRCGLEPAVAAVRRNYQA